MSTRPVEEVIDASKDKEESSRINSPRRITDFKKYEYDEEDDTFSEDDGFKRDVLGNQIDDGSDNELEKVDDMKKYRSVREELDDLRQQLQKQQCMGMIKDNKQQKEFWSSKDLGGEAARKFKALKLQELLEKMSTIHVVQNRTSVRSNHESKVHMKTNQ
ncbi:hypothetical protein AKO1_015751 [Acrasis kona]|uniref:Uncharacterized protein n=1 Tax=Acrasis kona TaxID=1008807 RepID=A0AAW2ZDA3_9EUKA